MRRCIIFLLVWIATAVQADDFTYKYLVMTDSEGTMTSLGVDELVITFADGQLTAVNADGTRTLTLATLSTMFFSETAKGTDAIDETTTGIGFPDPDRPVEIFTLGGLSRGTFSCLDKAREALPSGIYILKQNGTTTKTIIRK